MSEPSPEPISRRAARRAERGMRRETRRAVREGRKTLKAAYAHAAGEAQRMDPTVRERIGRANLTPADLRDLANYHVRDQFVPGQRWGDISRALGQTAADRLQRAGTGPAPTRNPFRQGSRRISRWRRQNTQQGTKALKAAFTQAARDAKRMDPAVLASIGRSGINRHDLAAVAQARFDQVFRPEGRFQAVPGQQPGQAQQMGQQRGQQVGQQLSHPGQQLSVPQQVAQLQQLIEAKQNQALQLMAEMNQLQSQMQQVIEARKAELNAEYAQLNALQPNGQQVQNGPEAGQRQQTPENEHVGFHPVVPDPAAANQQQAAEAAAPEQNGAQQNAAQPNAAEQNAAEQNGVEQNGAEQQGQNGQEQTGEVRQPGLDGEWMRVATGNAEPQPQQIPQNTQQSQTAEQSGTAEHQTAEHHTGVQQTGSQQTGEQQAGSQQAGSQQTGEQQTGQGQTAEQPEILAQQNGEQQTGQDHGSEEQTPVAANQSASGLDNPAYKDKADLAKGFDVAFGGLPDAAPSNVNDARRTAGSADTQRGQQQHRPGPATGTQKDQPTRGGS